jgi:RNA polymerase sigma-70 factor (ECF subfamily)
MLPDETLLKFLRIGDASAFEELYHRYWQKMFHSTIRKINNSKVAEDIVQTVFTDLWEKREVRAIQNVSAYLETAAKFQVINFIKSTITKKLNNAHIAENQNGEESTADLMLLMNEITKAIDEAINKLPQKTQTIFKLSRYDQRTNKEISNIMNLSEKSVEYHITQSLASLRFYLRDFVLIE